MALTPGPEQDKNKNPRLTPPSKFKRSRSASPVSELRSFHRICIVQISLVDRGHRLALLSLVGKNSTLPFRKVDNGSLERPTKLTLRLASRRTRHCPRKCAPGSRSPDRPLTFGTGLLQHY